MKTTLAAIALAVLVALIWGTFFWPRPSIEVTPLSVQEMSELRAAAPDTLLPGVVAEYVGNGDMLCIHVKRQLLLDKTEYGLSRNMSVSVQKLRNAILAVSGVKSVTVNAYEIQIEKAPLFDRVEIACAVKGLAETEHKWLIVEGK